MGTDTSTQRGVLAGLDRPGRVRAVDRYSPWDDVGLRYPHWVVRVRELDGPREVMSFRKRVILIDVGSGPAERRCSLAHAVAHIDLKHLGCDINTRYERREERDADELAAMRLIGIRALADAIRWTTDPREACEELDVDLDMLKVRGAHIYPHETPIIRAALAAREGIA